MSGLLNPAIPSPWRETHEHEEMLDVRGQRFLRTLFLGCKFEKVRSATFEHCSFQNSSWEPKKLEDLLGVTVTLDCFTWGRLRLNELAFDAQLYLLSKTVGNDQKREVLLRLIAPERTRDFEKLFSELERLK